ncbi:MAG: hypothetical protein COB19_06600 [Porticoccus sp.]|nr:MAG: hypothetical protein COB19_06600 [Porticoccus sp.]
MSNPERHLSLRLYTIVIAMGIWVGLAVFQTSYVAPKQGQAAVKRLSDLTDTTLKQFSLLLTGPLLKRDLATVYEMADSQLASNKYWKQIIIEEVNGRQLYPLTKSPSPLSTNSFVFETKVIFENTEIAKIKLFTDYSSALEKVKEFNQQLGYFQLLIVLLGLICAVYCLEKIVIKPLKRLSVAFLEMSDNNYQFSLPTSHASEIKQLIKDFSDARHTVHQDRQNLVRLKTASEQANAAKTNFLSMMSHELRTPLNSIIGFSDLCLHDECLPDTSRNVLATIKNSGQYLLDLISRLLNLSEIESGRLTLRKSSVSINWIFRDCKTLISPMAAKKQISITFAEVAPLYDKVLADKTAVMQIMLNLLTNAIKYSPTNSHVQVNCYPAQQNKLHISVNDNGNGLSSEQADIIFQPFTRLRSNLHNTEEGVGIGLSITKLLVEQMGGTIGVRSQVGKGSSFWFQLLLWRDNNDLYLSKNSALEKTDMAAGTTDVKESSHEQTTDNKTITPRYHILIAEDNLLNQKLIQRQLKSLNYDSTLTENGQQAFKKLQSGKFDLLLADLMMPVMDGLELIQKVRAMEKETGEHLPIVCLSADGMEATRKKAMEYGADMYITKPVDRKVVGESLHRCLVDKY